jgi:UDP-N-acetylglucosamine transferase subunit ALG13
MILVVTGTQLPFDRLIKVLDEIAPELDEEIVAQVNGSNYLPRHVNTIDILPPDEFDKLFERARLIVSHAGIGTIISAMQFKKPIIIFPRIAALGEHRNEHQLATATKMKEAGWVYVATDKEELKRLLLSPDLHTLCTIGNRASESLIKSITDFIEQ